MKSLLFFLFTFVSATLFAQETTFVPSEDTALLSVIVTDMENNIRPQDKIVFEGKHTHQYFEGISDKNGRFQILLPEGDIYLIKIQGLGEDIDFDELRIPRQEGKISGEVSVRYRPAKTFSLDDVHFETGKSVLLPTSFPTLNDLIEILQIKEAIQVEIAGHTDDIGDDISNLKLSQDRAEAVVNYLTKHGIDKSRLKAQGYGENQPIASNVTAEGRQENRRTEARVL